MPLYKCFKMGALVENKGVVIKLLWLVVLKICFEKLATMHVFSFRRTVHITMNHYKRSN